MWDAVQLNVWCEEWWEPLKIRVWAWPNFKACSRGSEISGSQVSSLGDCARQGALDSESEVESTLALPYVTSG